MEIQDAEFDLLDKDELGDTEMKDTKIKDTGFDLNEASSVDENKIEEYGYDGIEKIKEDDKNEDGDSDNENATSEADDAVLGQEVKLQMPLPPL
ncbi:hypothetical protein CY34DRAFT_15581 [Suillus luteus UH-Slu-Lm8-n1]|uniref:Uncharacterized protein n=1 Tax=Suillus luteus UH-Slu-Lm8-n1 TaxID=930992 RepID=A0A0D0ATN1_9AGAM|nr:hypothetical protein CY34DRAFT_15581 [Suillus luteus UH-Slu-Lm8-n1]